MIRYPYGVAAVLAFFVAAPVVVRAEDHMKKTVEHLEKAMKSAREGRAEGVVNHTEEAKKELIEENKEHPYTHLQKPIYGEHEKAEHDREVFEEMDIAIEKAKEGDSREAGEALERASTHLKERERAK
jgi:type III secretory pathway component EscR